MRFGLEGSLPAMAGTKRGPLLIVASGRCVWGDLARIGYRAWPGEIMCVKYMGVFFDRPFQHWASQHPEVDAALLKRLRERRPAWAHKVKLHSHRAAPGVDVAWSLGTGNSGIFSVQIAGIAGWNPIVAAGMPMDASGHFHDPPHRRTRFDADHLTAALEAMLPDLRGVFFSLSGRTRDIFGEPPAELLK